MDNQDDLKKIEALKAFVVQLLNYEIIPLKKEIAAAGNNQNAQLEVLKAKYNIAAENFTQKYNELIELCDRHGLVIETTMFKNKTLLN